jgi:HNH endonuclease
MAALCAADARLGGESNCKRNSPMTALFKPPGPGNPASRKPGSISTQQRQPPSEDDPIASAPNGGPFLQPTSSTSPYTRPDSSKPDTFNNAKAGQTDGGDVKLAQLLPPSVFFARPPVVFPRQRTPLEELPQGSAGGPGAGKVFPRRLNEEQPDKVPCIYCRTPTTKEPGPDKYNGEHVIPKSQVGNNGPGNHAPACQTCNLKKGGRTPAQWYERMQLQDMKS